jgi:hypothetical protein
MRALVLLFVAAVSLAAEAPAPSESLTLDELLQHMATTRGVVAEFREVKVMALLDSPLETKGTLYFVPPDKLARVTTTPAATRLVLDGNRMRFEDETGGKDVDLAENPVARGFAENLIVLWRGDRAALEAIYKLDFHADGPRWSLTLQPKGAPLDRFIASLRLSGDGRTMNEMELIETDGDRTQTVFEKTEVDHAFGDDEARAVFGPKAAQ